MLSITPIPAFNDNYLWLIDNGLKALIVDPGDAEPVVKHLKKHQLELVAILTTHHHADHVGGISKLKSEYFSTVYGPASDPIDNLDIKLSGGELIRIDALDLEFKIIAVPGHTKGHIAYYAENPVAAEPNAQQQTNRPLLFCGDTLFSAGCGRLFEGTAEQMWSSLLKLRELPENTQVFPAHEYTSSNLEFAQAVEGNNSDILEHANKVALLRETGTPSLPTSIGLEKRINPFLRVDIESVKNTAESVSKTQLHSEAEVFAQIRQWKDRF